ncbi:chemokine XC receptor [Pimephales promelas]|nr:chemokine XC receptor [Pimephales promelas]
MYGWTLGDPACKAVNYVFYTGYYSSIIFLTVLTVHRYMAVVHPMSVVMSRKSLHCYATSIVIWIISFCAAIPQAMFNSVVDADETTPVQLCDFEGEINWKLQTVYLQNFFFVVSFVIIAFCYTVILTRLLRPTSHTRKKTVQLIFFIVVFFFLGWGPYNVAIFLDSLTSWGISPFNECEVSRSVDYWMYISRMVALSHCCLNPVFYVFMGIKFRNHLKKMSWAFRKKNNEPQNRHSRLIYSNGEEISICYSTRSNTNLEMEPSNLTSSSNNSTSSDDDYEYNGTEGELIKMCEVDDYKKMTAVCYATVFCLSILGNGFLICALTCYEDLKRVTNLFMFCLALFDLLFTLTLPFWVVDFLHHWVFGDVACKIMTGAYFVGIYGSLILLTAMTLDRFVVVVVRSCWLTRRRRLKCSKVACVGAWIISVIACLRDSVASKAQKIHVTTYACQSTMTVDDNVGYYSQLILLFLVPFALIVFCYTKIIITLMSTQTRQKYRTVVLVLCIVIAFFICWGPYHIIIVMMSIYEFNPCEHYELHVAFVVCRILAFSHCCVNPALYILRGKYRNLLSSFLFCSPELRQSGPYRGATDPSDSRIHPYTNEGALGNGDVRQTNATELNTM